MNERPTLNLRQVRRRFDNAAASFESADFVHAMTREGLFARLLPLVIDAKTILDLGSATGSAAAPLRRRFGGAHVVSLDLSQNMLQKARRNRPRFSFARSSYVQADAGYLPFEDHSIDLVFCNMLLPFVGTPDRVFGEVARVLRKDGVFAFATLGPDSLLEVRRAWRRIDDYAHVNDFLDMHDVGDALLRSGLRDPVLDVDRLSVHYEDPASLFADLTRVGGRNALRERNPSLVSRGQFDRMLRALVEATADGGIQLALELVYGHCWGGGARTAPGQFSIDASRIPHRRR